MKRAVAYTTCRDVISRIKDDAYVTVSACRPKEPYWCYHVPLSNNECRGVNAAGLNVQDEPNIPGIFLAPDLHESPKESLT